MFPAYRISIGTFFLLPCHAKILSRLTCLYLSSFMAAIIFVVTLHMHELNMHSFMAITRSVALHLQLSRFHSG